MEVEKESRNSKRRKWFESRMCKMELMGVLQLLVMTRSRVDSRAEFLNSSTTDTLG